jgi:HEAT repeat protein
VDGASVRRREVALAGHLGDSSTARRLLDDPDPTVRASALGALSRVGALRDEDLRIAWQDPAPEVRARASELAVRAGVDSQSELVTDLVTALADVDWRAVEASCFALGELGPDVARNREAVEGLAKVTGGHRDPLCREAAVAALGAIGSPLGLEAILAATGDKPAVRRRAVLALAAFEGDEVEAALEVALSDRDWQVRQAAEDLTGERNR